MDCREILCLCVFVCVFVFVCVCVCLSPDFLHRVRGRPVSSDFLHVTRRGEGTHQAA